jgi:hypothetical protein
MTNQRHWLPYVEDGGTIAALILPGRTWRSLANSGLRFAGMPSFSAATTKLTH